MKKLSLILLTLGLIQSLYAHPLVCPTFQELTNFKATDATPVRSSPVQGNLYQVMGQLSTSNKTWHGKTSSFRALGKENAMYTVEQSLQQKRVTITNRSETECRYAMQVDFPWGWGSIGLILRS